MPLSAAMQITIQKVVCVEESWNIVWFLRTQQQKQKLCWFFVQNEYVCTKWRSCCIAFFDALCFFTWNEKSWACIKHYISMLEKGYSQMVCLYLIAGYLSQKRLITVENCQTFNHTSRVRKRNKWVKLSVSFYCYTECYARSLDAIKLVFPNWVSGFSFGKLCSDKEADLLNSTKTLVINF